MQRRAHTQSESTARRGHIPRPGTRVIGVTGADALAFLQGQLTLDCAALSPANGRLGAICTAQGKVTALLRVFRLEDGFALALPSSLADGVLAHLERHRLRSRVGLDPIDQSCHLYAATAAPTRPLLARIEHAGGAGEYLLAGAMPPAEAEHFADWQRLAVCCGLPEIAPATVAEFLPQWLNLDLLGGIGFTKGCYLGQEVIARIQHLARLKRRMLRLACPGVPLPPGARLHAGTEPVAEVVLSAPVGTGTELLAVVRLDCIDLLPQALPGVERRDLPYPLPEL